ncbi:MAG: hypothetical protein GWP06_04260 [Actinobacteria bacterium]|nr:hypothetical protein [Actinomycetota bacterium]
MFRKNRFLLVLSVLPLIFACSTFYHAREKVVSPQAVKIVTPLIRAHAHNDYAHVHPLFDALDHGFCSVEADIYLLDGKLYVTHDEKNIQKDRTLESLYLDPLRKRIKANRGRVYPGIKQITLFIDIKSDADSTYRVLRKVLKKYKNMLTEFTPQSRKDRAIVIILSGNRPFDLMRNETKRYVACDGRLSDLNAPENVNLIPIISDKWSDYFKWHGAGEMPKKKSEKLKQFVARAHGNGQRIRFWDTDSNVVENQQRIWKVLLEANVDLINTDDLDGLQRFLLNPHNSSLK